MSKKRFRLETVLRVARIREKQHERSLAERLRDEQKAAADLAERKHVYELRPTGGDFRQEHTVGELRARAVQDAGEARRAAEEQLAAARDQWLAATRHRRAVEQLEDRHMAATAMIAARASQRALDDMARARRRGMDR
jgi:flagellar biosynthesis chaperone FliJ